MTERNISSAHPEVLEGRAKYHVPKTNVVAPSWFESLTTSGSGCVALKVAV